MLASAGWSLTGGARCPSAVSPVGRRVELGGSRPPPCTVSTVTWQSQRPHHGDRGLRQDCGPGHVDWEPPGEGEGRGGWVCTGSASRLAVAGKGCELPHEPSPCVFSPYCGQSPA